MILEVLKQLVTGKDNTTHDLGRYSWIVSTLSVVAAGAWNGLHAHLVDLMALAQALAVVVAAHGGALWAKAGTEPAPPAPEVKP